MSWKDFWENCRQRLVDEIADDAYYEGIEKGIHKTILSLYDANVSDNDIINLLNKYWDIPRSEAKDRLNRIQTVIAPDYALFDYMESIGMSKKDISMFLGKNRAKIRCNPNLWKQWQNPEKLYEELQN